MKEISRAAADKILKVPKGYKILEQKLDANDGGRYQYMSCYKIGGLTSEKIKRRRNTLIRKKRKEMMNEARSC